MAYTTPQAVRAYLGIDGSTDDALIEDMITRAQTAIETYTDRVFESSSQTTHYFEVGKDTDGDYLYFDDDLAAINTVKTNADYGSGYSLTENTDYITMPRNDTPYYGLKMLGSSAYYWQYTDDPEMGIEVNGNWAYSTSPPADIVHACIRLVGYYYRQKDSQVFDVTAIPEAGVIQTPVGIPADVRKTLDQYKAKSYV